MRKVKKIKINYKFLIFEIVWLILLFPMAYALKFVLTYQHYEDKVDMTITDTIVSKKITFNESKCNKENFDKYRELADKVQFELGETEVKSDLERPIYDENRNKVGSLPLYYIYYDLKLTNIDPNLYVLIDETENISLHANEDGTYDIVMTKPVNPEKLEIKFISKSNECISQEVKKIDITIPEENSFVNNDLCKKYKDKQICNEYLFSKTNDFKKIYKYIEESEKFNIKKIYLYMIVIFVVVSIIVYIINKVIRGNKNEK